MARSLCPSPIAALCVASHEHRQYHPCSATDDDDDEEEDVEFEFRPLLLPQPRGADRAIVERPSRTGRRRVAAAANNVVTRHSARRAPTSVSAAASAKAPEQPAAPRRAVRWHHMAFGSVRVPSAMDMGEIRRRLKARQQQQVDGGSANNGPSAAEAEAWAPWRLIRSLSCKGVEAVAVAAVAAPVRLV